MAKTVLKAGDIFQVHLENGNKKFFQYLMDDSNLFNTNIIRGFDYELKEGEVIDLAKIASSKIVFHAHTVVKSGVKLCGWEKVGNAPLEQGFQPPFFRSTPDVYSKVKKSNNWSIWRAGEPGESVGRLKDKFRAFDFGAVTHPIDIGNWLQNGKHSFLYPE